VARAIGTDHHEIVISRQDFMEVLPRLIWHEDEPITWPSSVSLYFVSKLASENVKVVLTGEGSDELFAGYERYRWNLLNQRGAEVYRRLVPAAARRLVRERLASTSLLRAPLRRKLGHTFLGREDSLESLYLDNFYGAFSADAQARLIGRPAGAAYGNYRRYWDARPHAPLLSRMLYADQKTYLVELLMKQDQMSMACSIESRVPLLDHEFVEFAMRVPDRLKIRGGNQKFILKKAIEDLLPREIVYRKKMGFPTPIRSWLGGMEARGFAADLCSPDKFLASYLDLKELEALIARHSSGLEDATDRLWRLLNLQLWGEIFLNGKPGTDTTLPRFLPCNVVSVPGFSR
jgi:asparagine synthase (glutamine-hydrolysing)